MREPVREIRSGVEEQNRGSFINRIYKYKNYRIFNKDRIQRERERERERQRDREI